MREARRKNLRRKEENNVSQESHKEKSSVQLCQAPEFSRFQKWFSRGCGNVVEMFSYAMRLSFTMSFWIVRMTWIFCICIIVREVDEGF